MPPRFSGQTGFMLLCLGLLPVYIWLATLGYGANIDSYLTLGAWQRMVETGLYSPSRGQGYPVAELAVGFLAALGGSAAANTGSLLLAAATLGLGYDLLRRLKAPSARPALAFVMVNPHWMVAAVTPLDYIYAAFFLTLGLWLMARRWWAAAGLALALAVGARFAYAPLAAGAAVAAVIWSPPEDRIRRIEGLLAFTLLTAALFLPAFIRAHLTLGFLTYSDLPVNPPLAQLGRVVWKVPGLYGQIGFLLLTAALAPHLWRLRQTEPRARLCPGQRRLLYGAGALLTAETAIYAYLPAGIPYQIPSLLAVAGLLALFPLRRIWWAALLGSQILIWFIQPDYLTPRLQPRACMATRIADGVDFGLTLRPGVLIQHAQESAEAVCALPKRLPHPPATPWEPLPALRSPFTGTRDRKTES